MQCDIVYYMNLLKIYIYVIYIIITIIITMLGLYQAY